jgi:DNA-binding XRE family transcriptional regulator
MEEKDFYTLEEIEDEFVGVEGTPRRDKYEADLNAFLIGEAIKQARETKNLTQEQLGELMGVKRAQISKIESGKSISFSTIVRAFKAMGVKNANLELESLGKVALW